MRLCLPRSGAWAGSCLGHLQALGEAEKGRVRGIPPQCQLGPPVSSAHCRSFMLVFPRPHSVGASLPSFGSFHQTRFFWWPCFPGTDDAHTRPGCFAWRPARGWHSVPVTSLSPPLNTRPKKKKGGSGRAGITAGIQHVDSIPCFPPRSLVPLQSSPSPQTSVSLAERLIPFRQHGRNRENSLPRGRGWPK